MTELIPPPHAGVFEGLPTRWSPAYTEREATELFRIARTTYRRCLLHAKAVVDHHEAIGTVRPLWEPQATHVERITGANVDEAAQTLLSALEQHVTPSLKTMAAANERAEGDLRAAEEGSLPVTTTETRTTFSGLGAVERAEEHSRFIERDTAEGKTHHRRSRMLRGVGYAAPWADAVGLAAFVALVTNVNLLNPFVDTAGWLWAVIVVAGFGMAAALLAPLAGRAHNVAREARADDRRQEADVQAALRNRWLAVVLALAGISTTVLLARTFTVLELGQGEYALLVTVCVILLVLTVGVLMPGLAYLGAALDGSKRSRELADLTKQLDEDLERHDELRTRVATALDETDREAARLRTEEYPQVLEQAQVPLTEGHREFEFTRDLIGALSGDPSAIPPRVLRRDEEEFVGHLSTGVAGARTVNLQPLFDREARRAELAGEAQTLRERLGRLEPHPWTRD